jgi:predicted MFS family arabinose efflux permease
MAKLLIVIGLAVAAAGVAVYLGVPLGRLPGDMIVRRGAFSFYFPLTTSVLVSVVLTILFALLRR